MRQMHKGPAQAHGVMKEAGVLYTYCIFKPSCVIAFMKKVTGANSTHFRYRNSDFEDIARVYA